ncbi:MAG: RnfABCDGE type electron transport complex subunit G [Tannerellaceae bacterium]|nr:RnfABCDGE type electron transport complex subunit G [Tannerellaceae bacterium]
MFLSLFFTCVASGLIVTGSNLYTATPIAESKKAAVADAIRRVTPEFDNNPVDEVYFAATSDGDSLRIYPAKKAGAFVGCAVESSTKKGFSGEIKIMVGFDVKGVLINYSVLSHAETPGLGSKMESWFRTDKKNQSVIGRSLASGGFSVFKDGGDVDAITAATISSRAFLDAVNRAYSAYAQTDSSSGASPQKEDDNEK